MILESPAPITALPKPGNALILYIYDDSGAASDPPHPHQEMHGILCISNDSGFARAPAQQYAAFFANPPRKHQNSKKTIGFPYFLKGAGRGV